MDSQTTNGPSSSSSRAVLDEDTVMRCAAQSCSKVVNDWDLLVLAISLQEYFREEWGKFLQPFSSVMTLKYVKWKTVHRLASNFPTPYVVKTCVVGDVNYRTQWISPETCAEKADYILSHLNEFIPSSSKRLLSYWGEVLKPGEFTMGQLRRFIQWTFRKIISTLDGEIPKDVGKGIKLSTSKTLPEVERTEVEISLAENEKTRESLDSVREKHNNCSFEVFDSHVLIENIPNEEGQTSTVLSEKRTSTDHSVSLIQDKNRQAPVPNNEQPMQEQKSGGYARDIFLIKHANDEIPNNEWQELPKRQKLDLCEERKLEFENNPNVEEYQAVSVKVHQSKPAGFEKKLEGKGIIMLPDEKYSYLNVEPDNTIRMVWKLIYDCLAACSERIATLQQNKAVKKPIDLEFVSKKIENGDIQTIVQLQNLMCLMNLNLYMTVPQNTACTLENWMEPLKRVLTLLKNLTTHPKGSWTESSMLRLLDSDSTGDNETRAASADPAKARGKFLNIFFNLNRIQRK